MSNLAWSLAALNRAGLAALPHDLLLQIYSLLDVVTAVALSKVSPLLLQLCNFCANFIQIRHVDRFTLLPCREQHG
jgi:hypothetical protein